MTRIKEIDPQIDAPGIAIERLRLLSKDNMLTFGLRKLDDYQIKQIRQNKWINFLDLKRQDKLDGEVPEEDTIEVPRVWASMSSIIYSDYDREDYNIQVELETQEVIVAAVVAHSLRDWFDGVCTDSKTIEGRVQDRIVKIRLEADAAIKEICLKKGLHNDATPIYVWGLQLKRLKVGKPVTMGEVLAEQNKHSRRIAYYCPLNIPKEVFEVWKVYIKKLTFWNREEQGIINKGKQMLIEAVNKIVMAVRIVMADKMKDIMAGMNYSADEPVTLGSIYDTLVEEADAQFATKYDSTTES